MQGLGSGAISIFGSHEQKQRYLPGVVSGSAMQRLPYPSLMLDRMSRRSGARPGKTGDSYLISGEKTWISNGGIADFYLLFAALAKMPALRASPPLSWTLPLPIGDRGTN